jgi:glucose-1-phosphatase
MSESKATGKPNLSTIRHIVLDLGGVLYEIDVARFQANMHELAEQSAQSFDDKSRAYFIRHSHLFETGHYSPEVFRNKMLKQFFPSATAEQFEAAWNSVLVGVYPERVELIRQLAKRHSVHLLSNTNVLHFQHYFLETEELFKPMKKLFWSFELGYRKPDADVFKHVLNEIKAPVKEVLFVDDTPENLDSARRLGFRTVLADPTNPQLLLAELAELL